MGINTEGNAGIFQTLLYLSKMVLTVFTQALSNDRRVLYDELTLLFLAIQNPQDIILIASATIRTEVSQIELEVLPELIVPSLNGDQY